LCQGWATLTGESDRTAQPDFADCYVFLGPSLPVKAAREILPARFLPPAKCGDIFKLLRLHPKVILIVDGYFEHHAAVWHKDILYAFHLGVQVLGAASMGALSRK
jgi:hypothetical protein